MSIDYKYYARTKNGHTIKILVEVLQSCLTNEAYFKLQTSGIEFRCFDNLKTTLINISLPMENFDEYKCNEDICIAVNLKHFHKILKNIKKKDSISLQIDKSNPTKLEIVIIPISIGRLSERKDTSGIIIREIELAPIRVPESYHYPKVIPSSEYQKMCKKMALVPGKIVEISIQKSNYIKFYCDGGDIFSSGMEFGEIEKTDSEFYRGNFYTTMLNQLIKMPGLSSQMQISAPIQKGYPIKFKMQAGPLGLIEIFLKTKEQIEYEESQRNEN